MNLNAKELVAYINEHDADDRFVVEVVDVNVPVVENGVYNKQKPRVLAKRLIILSAYDGANSYKPRIYYSMYNSFKNSNCYVPDDFMFILLQGAESQAILDEYDEHVHGLEKDFRDAFNNVHADIEAKVNEASKLMKEAEELSKQSGVPFRPSKEVGGFALSYMPASFQEKFGDTELVSQLAQELTGAYGGSYEGWQTSQTC